MFVRSALFGAVVPALLGSLPFVVANVRAFGPAEWFIPVAILVTALITAGPLGAISACILTALCVRWRRSGIGWIRVLVALLVCGACFGFAAGAVIPWLLHNPYKELDPREMVLMGQFGANIGGLYGLLLPLTIRRPLRRLTVR